MSGIIWLASYPKSGNTWFRIFLTNLRGNGERPVDINELDRTPLASARRFFDEAAGIDSADLTMDEIDRLRPEVYEYIARNTDEADETGKSGDTLFMKVHDAYTYLDDGTPLFPDAATGGAIYFIRNPLDVAVSFSHHNSDVADHDKTISRMADKDFSFCSRGVKLHDQLRQRLLSWSAHVLSWVERPGFPVCILRYEDMVGNPVETFERAVRFSGLGHDREKIEQALAFSSFEMLQGQERTGNFRERSPASRAFFRKGRIGSWREELTRIQADRIVEQHREVMMRFGYLGKDGEIRF